MCVWHTYHWAELQPSGGRWVKVSWRWTRSSFMKPNNEETSEGGVCAHAHVCVRQEILLCSIQSGLFIFLSWEFYLSWKLTTRGSIEPAFFPVEFCLTKLIMKAQKCLLQKCCTKNCFCEHVGVSHHEPFLIVSPLSTVAAALSSLSCVTWPQMFWRIGRSSTLELSVCLWSDFRKCDIISAKWVWFMWRLLSAGGETTELFYRCLFSLSFLVFLCCI